MLVTTSVIDNGVNINDKKVTEIVLLNIGKTEFLQFIGRKRIVGDERVMLHLTSFSHLYFSNKLNQVNAELKEYSEAKENTCKFLVDHIDGSPKFKCIYYDDIKNGAFVNELSSNKLDIMHELLETVCESFKEGEEDYYFNKQIEWLSPYIKRTYLGLSPNASELYDWLDGEKGKEITAEESADYLNNLREKMNEILGKDSTVNGQNIEKGYSAERANNRFNRENLPFKIVKMKDNSILIIKTSTEHPREIGS